MWDTHNYTSHCFTFFHSLRVFLISLSLPFLCCSNRILGQAKVNYIGWGGKKMICEIETIKVEGERVVCEMVRGIQKAEGGMIEYWRGKIGSPHPPLSPSVIPLPFSWLALFGHVTVAIAEREREREWGKDGQIVLFLPSQNWELWSDERRSRRKART